MKCSKCGSEVDNTISVGELELCENCFNEGYYTCEKCDEAILKGTECCTDDGHILCGECFDANYVQCEGCGASIPKNGAEEISGSYYCGSCLDENFIYCSECDEIVPIEDAREHNGIWYCETCFDNTFRICAACGEVIPEDEVEFVDGSDYCEDCFHDIFTTCDRCGDVIRRTDAIEDCYNTFCPDCFNNYYFYCDRCDSIYPVEDIHEDDNGVYCTCCADDLGILGGGIENYYYKPAPIFYGSSSPEDLYMGVELEVDGGGEHNDNANYVTELINQDGEFVYCKHDGSLDEGFEIVSHPTTLDYHWHNADWQSVMKRALEKGYRSHDAGTAGLHVHLSKAFFGTTYDEQDKNIMKLLYLVERFWKEMVKFSRRTESQLQQWAKRYGLCSSPEELLNTAKGSERYHCVNLQNDYTVEIRMFRGTLRYNTFIATLQFCGVLAEVAVNTSVQEIQSLTWESFLDCIPEDYTELNEYLEKRKLLPSNKEEIPVEEKDDGSIVGPFEPINGCDCPLCRAARLAEAC